MNSKVYIRKENTRSRTMLQKIREAKKQIVLAAGGKVAKEKDIQATAEPKLVNIG